jgi:DNA-binding HxlR family transcriptional regulator
MLLERNSIPINEPIKTHLKITLNPLFQNGLCRRRQYPPLPPQVSVKL